MDTLMNMQALILLFLQDTIRSPLLTTILEFTTDLGNMGFIWVVPALLLLFKKKTRPLAVAVLTALVLSLIITNGLLKNLIKEARPFVTYPEIIPLVTHVSASSYAFPSGHASASFAAAPLFFHYLPKKYGIPALVLAFLISFSRLYLGVHYPLDVVAGLFIGLGCAWLAVKMVSKVMWEI